MGNLSILGCVLTMALTGCVSQHHNPEKPIILAHKGVYFSQDTSKSIAANVAAFAGYDNVFTDRETKGRVVLTGAETGVSTQPFSHSSTVVMIRLLVDEDFDDKSVARRAIVTMFEKENAEAINIDPTSIAYRSQLKRKAFAEKKDMSSISCNSPSVMSGTGLFLDADLVCGDDTDDTADFRTSVYFSRPATGLEFPELRVLPKGEYAVLLINTYSHYQLKKDAGWAATYDSHTKTFKFNGRTLPFVRPVDQTKRLVINGDMGE